MSKTVDPIDITTGCQLLTRIKQMREDGKHEAARFLCMDTTAGLMEYHDTLRCDITQGTVRRLVGQLQEAAGLQ